MEKLYIGYTPKKWETIKTHPYFAGIRKTIIDRADGYINTPPARVKFSDMHLFVTTGNREIYQKAFFELTARAESMYTSYLLTEDEKYLEPLADALWDICNLETWSLPAHVKEDVSIKRRRVWLDLCSTELGGTLGEIITMLGDKLPELVVRRVREEVRERVIESYKNYDYWWKAVKSNWAAVCIAGVLSAYLYCADKDEIEEQLPNMCFTAESYLESFDEEGCCKEGYAYWSYGFTYFCRFADLIKNYTGGRIDYFKQKKVHNIALFQQNVAINSTQCVRFSDCGEFFRPEISLAHLLRATYDDVQIPPIPPSTEYRKLWQLMWLDPAFENCEMEHKDFIYHENQWYIKRCKSYNFVCKAGCNQELHNHNDVGSFMISKNGRVTFTDPGGGEYTRQYFSAERYNILVTGSQGHSVPIINGHYQVTRADRSAILAEGEREYGFTMDNAYDIPTLTSLTRHFSCLDDELIMTDRYEFSEVPSEVTERLVTLVRPEIIDGRVLVGDTELIYDRNALTLKLSEGICDRAGGIKETLYMLDLTVNEPKAKIEISFKFI